MEKDGKIYIDGKSSSQYIPKQRFYYMEGDNMMKYNLDKITQGLNQ